jgi:hypothetical protein
MRRDILVAGDLPAVGSGHETLAVDLKGDLYDAPEFEPAKDVAAFANAAGGTLIHRAYEDTSRRVLGKYAPMSEKYAPMSEKEAGKLVQAYDLAIKERCSPSPVWSHARIEYEGGIVVAINVLPSPGQVIGVRVSADEGNAYRGNSYLFPLRVGTQTRYLLPGELPMFMAAEFRMIVVALEAIPQSEWGKICLIQLHSAHGRHLPKTDAGIKAIEPERNALRFNNGQSFPISQIRAVWHNGRQWCISVNEVDLG